MFHHSCLGKHLSVEYLITNLENLAAKKIIPLKHVRHLVAGIHHGGGVGPAEGLAEAARELAATLASKPAVAMAQTIFKRCKGWKSFELHRSIEKPSRYRLHITWETLENHTVDFRESENFTEWRGLVGPHFAEPPQVEHTNTVLRF